MRRLPCWASPPWRNSSAPSACPSIIHDLVGAEVTDAQLEELADKCSATANDNLGKMKVLHRADMLAIYTAAR